MRREPPEHHLRLILRPPSGPHRPRAGDAPDDDAARRIAWGPLRILFRVAQPSARGRDDPAARLASSPQPHRYGRVLDGQRETRAPAVRAAGGAPGGVEVERIDGALECILPFRHEIVGNAALPAVHGGVLGALLELTALLHLLDDSGSERVPKPITFSVDYLRAAGPSTTRARAEIFKLGRRIANVRVVAWQDDRSRPVVAGNGKFLLS